MRYVPSELYPRYSYWWIAPASVENKGEVFVIALRKRACVRMKTKAHNLMW